MKLILGWLQRDWHCVTSAFLRGAAGMEFDDTTHRGVKVTSNVILRVYKDRSVTIWSHVCYLGCTCGRAFYKADALTKDEALLVSLIENNKDQRHAR